MSFESMADAIRAAYTTMVVQTFVGPDYATLAARAKELPESDRAMFWLLALVVTCNGDTRVEQALAKLDVPPAQIAQARLFHQPPMKRMRDLIGDAATPLLVRASIAFLSAMAAVPDGHPAVAESWEHIAADLQREMLSRFLFD